MKIAHISDLHLNSESSSSIFAKVKSVLKFISRNGYDHLVITGDISDNSSQKDFFVLKNLLARYGFLKWDKLSIVIGNHDIYGGFQTADEILNFPKKFAEIDYHKKVEEFVSYFHESMENCVYNSQNHFFPFAKKLDDVLIVGLNSNAKYSSLSNPFASNGEVGVSQFSELIEILKIQHPDIKHRIILTHHHFHKLKAESQSSLGKIWQNIEKQTMKLKNKRRLFRLFNDYKVDLVLHGHVHQSKEYFRKGIRFLNSGGSFRNYKSKNLFINSITISKKNIDIVIEQIKPPETLSKMGSVKNKNVYTNGNGLLKEIQNLEKISV